MTLITTGGIILRTPAKDIPCYSRVARGAQVMRMKNGSDTIASIAIVENQQARRTNGKRNGQRNASALAGEEATSLSEPSGDNGVSEADGAEEDFGAEDDFGAEEDFDDGEARRRESHAH
ncbi:MAG: hypothetical protein M5R40_20030 [Anaerolineae bacterium]|nr:hypothetical protein [Anaerolineae bacterium]